MLSYIVENHDLEFPEEYGNKRLESKWLAEAIVPPSWAKVRV